MALEQGYIYQACLVGYRHLPAWRITDPIKAKLEVAFRSVELDVG